MPGKGHDYAEMLLDRAGIVTVEVERRNINFQGGPELEAYCVKCKAKREIKNPTATTMKNGKPATTGECSTCGTKVFKIGKA